MNHRLGYFMQIIPSLELSIILITIPKPKGNIDDDTNSAKDPQYPFYVMLHFKAYKIENAIDKWQKLNIREKPVTLETLDFTSSFFFQLFVVLSDSFLFGDWANEMRMEETLLAQGIHHIESKLGTRATNFDLLILLCFLQTSRQMKRNGKVLVGTLAWSGNFKLSFENIKYSEDFGNLLRRFYQVSIIMLLKYTLAPNTTLYNTIFLSIHLFLFRKGQASRKSSPMGYQLRDL